MQINTCFFLCVEWAERATTVCDGGFSHVFCRSCGYRTPAQTVQSMVPCSQRMNFNRMYFYGEHESLFTISATQRCGRQVAAKWRATILRYSSFSFVPAIRILRLMDILIFGMSMMVSHVLHVCNMPLEGCVHHRRSHLRRLNSVRRRNRYIIHTLIYWLAIIQKEAFFHRRCECPGFTQSRGTAKRRWHIGNVINFECKFLLWNSRRMHTRAKRLPCNLRVIYCGAQREQRQR